MEKKVIERKKLQTVFEKNSNQVIDLIKSVGFSIKEEYTEKEFSLMVAFVNKAEKQSYIKENFYPLFGEKKSKNSLSHSLKETNAKALMV